MNTDAPWRELSQVLPRVVVMPTKLDQWEWPIPAATFKRTPVVVCEAVRLVRGSTVQDDGP